MPQIKIQSYPGHVPDDRISEGFEKCAADALEGFEEDGEAPFFVVIIQDKSNEVIQWSDGGIPYDFIKRYYAGKARAYYACFESWYVATRTEIKCMPSEHPDRKEGMVVIGESRAGWQEMAMWEIIRNGAGTHLVRKSPGTEKISSVLSEVLWSDNSWE